MKSNHEIFINAANNAKIENVTTQECILANLIQMLIYKSKEILYKEQLYKITQNPHEEYENFMEEDNTIKIIVGYKNTFKSRGKYYLMNTWGINTDEIANDIKTFEQDFKNFFDNLDEDVKKEFNLFTEEINTTNPLPCDNDEQKDYSIKVLYAYYKFIGTLDKNIAFTNLYIHHIEQYEELKHKIYNAATRNSYEYVAELRVNVLQDSYHKHLPLEACIVLVMIFNQLYTNFKNKKNDRELNYLKEAYKKIIAGEKDHLNDFINIMPPFELDFLNGDILSKLNELGKHYSIVNFFSSNNVKYMYMLYHALLSYNEDINEYKKFQLKCGVGRLLYDGYVKWCRKNKFEPLIGFQKSQLIEYPSSANDIPKEHYHFPKKRFINNSINEKREKLNKYFLEALHQGMIEGEIIAADTKSENFLFVFGYGEDIIANFKPIEVLKPDTSYERENGKRTIRYLLEELMKYSDDEIRPSINGKKHLILNSCFSITDHQFKSSDFEKNQIYKGNEIIKIGEIYATALKKAKEQNV